MFFAQKVILNVYHHQLKIFFINLFSHSQRLDRNLEELAVLGKLKEIFLKDYDELK